MGGALTRNLEYVHSESESVDVPVTFDVFVDRDDNDLVSVLLTVSHARPGKKPRSIHVDLDSYNARQVAAMLVQAADFADSIE